MLILSSTLARTRHARLWALSFAIYAVEWALAAALDAIKGPLPPLRALTGLLAIGGVFCYYAGFQQRRHRQTHRALWAIVVVLALFQLLILIPDQTRLITVISFAFFPALRMIMLVMAALAVAPDHNRASATERSIIWMLGLAALANGGVFVTAILEFLREVPDGSFTRAASLVGSPMSAAMGLFTLMLIASDFSRERMRLIHTDPLTGVLNRQGFEEAARRAIARARPPGRPLALALADVDRFKTINDRFGHLTGDAALISFARHISDGLPETALVGRFGGEEFALILEGEDADGALPYVEGIRTSLDDMAIPGSAALDLTASFGIAEQLPRETLDDLYTRADAALYRSKQDGRNRSSIDPARAA